MALINLPPHVNPKIVAREGIKACQFLIMGIKELAYGQYDTQQLKVELNKVLRDYNKMEGRIRSVIVQRDGVIYPYSILNSAPNFHSYFTL